MTPNPADVVMLTFIILVIGAWAVFAWFDHDIK